MKIRIVITAIIALFMAAEKATAKDCGYHQRMIEHYTNLKRNGGTQKELTYWHRERNIHKREFSGCQFSAADKKIESAGGHAARRIYEDNRTQRQVNTNNEALRKVIETCNFWIREHNNKKSQETKTQRDVACKAADKGHSEITQSRPLNIEHSRTLSECKKPNNLIDNEVSLCLQGVIDPYWN